MADNTLVIFTSDNGCSRVVRIKKLADKGHKVSGPFRGSKSDIWEGGHRIPFVACWPGHIEPGSESKQTICLNDTFATFAELIGSEVPAGSCEDSVSFLPAFSGKTIESSRRGIVHHSIHGHFSYRFKNWKLLLARGSGGWSSPNEKQSAGAPVAQLYDMDADIAEQSNRFEDNSEVADQLLEMLNTDIYSGRSTEGPASKNDIDEIEMWKSGKSR